MDYPFITSVAQLSAIIASLIYLVGVVLFVTHFIPNNAAATRTVQMPLRALSAQVADWANQTDTDRLALAKAEINNVLLKRGARAAEGKMIVPELKGTTIEFNTAVIYWAKKLNRDQLDLVLAVVGAEFNLKDAK